MLIDRYQMLSLESLVGIIRLNHIWRQRACISLFVADNSYWYYFIENAMLKRNQESLIKIMGKNRRNQQCWKYTRVKIWQEEYLTNLSISFNTKSTKIAHARSKSIQLTWANRYGLQSTTSVSQCIGKKTIVMKIKVLKQMNFLHIKKLMVFKGWFYFQK